LRIQVTNRWFDQEFAHDKATIADVQAGRVQLAKVNARAYDTVGIDSFQALVAPLLIDNPTLERRVLESDLAGEMLAGTSKLGLVGLAMLPTDLRRPLGLSRPLVRVKDYRGARIGVREGEVAKGTLIALGATPSVPSRADRSGAWTESNSTWAGSTGTSTTYRRRRSPPTSASGPGR
jgi:TRAP-type C4-dicarboxylate transport system substrate-binding protein